MSWTGRSPYKTLMALFGTVVCDSWKLVHLLNLVCSFQWCVLLMRLAERLYRDKGLYKSRQRLCQQVHLLDSKVLAVTVLLLGPIPRTVYPSTEKLYLT